MKERKGAGIKNNSNGIGIRYDRIDESLPWNKIQPKAKPRKCDSCVAERRGTCNVSGYTIPKDNNCAVSNENYSSWYEEFMKI